MMDVFSLEEDDGCGLFITQEPKKVNFVGDNVDLNEDVNRDLVDLMQNCEGEAPHYSDVSDDDFVDIPSSQLRNNAGEDR